ncbi:TldD/PmbA family protein [Clostridium algidicarnis]|uniref:PmbA protein n=1 Tax=Clostridium algidicarnis DSM 15099 TaxID=1121295 RepID=A0A2S6FWH2_9CLOT|nr:TldD/PmbA family protein [Clostridium algidicarnis]PPK47935.1 PmbA protein [Clostridium algidicarnis DSM 15099]
MDIKFIKEIIFERAKDAGFSEFEIYYSKDDNLSIGVYKGDIDKYSVNTTMGISFRGIYKGNMGYSYTELIDEEAIDTLLESAKQSAVSIDNNEEEIIYGEKQNYVKLNCYNEELSNISTKQKIDFIKDLESKTLNFHEKVETIAGCELESSTIEYGIMNSKGIELDNKQNFISAYVVPVIKEKDIKYDGFKFKITQDFKELDIKMLAKESVGMALDRVGGETVNSGNYKIVLKNDVMAMMLSTFIGAFSAENAEKGLSLLKGKEGRIIANPIVSLVDDPHLEGSFASTPFDAEAVATYKKYMIKDGYLNTLLYNLKSATKEGKKSTGNAYKSSFASSISIAPTNCYIEKGKSAFEDVLNYVGEGILITDIEGTHAGANAITGDFSLAAKGFSIKLGKRADPIEQITVAGNFFELLKDIEYIGEDLEFTIPMGANFGSPSVVIKSLSVAGK